MSFAEQLYFMINEVIRIQSGLTAELEKISSINSPLERAALAGKETYDKMREVLAFISSYSFVSGSEEVEVFKKSLPSIFAQYYYWSLVLDLEVRKKGKSPDMIRSLLSSESSEVNKFYNANRSFFKYYFEALTFFDEQIFRKEGRELWPFDDFTPQFDAPIPKASELIGTHLAYEKYITFLSTEAEALANITGIPGPVIELVISDADLAELVPPIHLLKLLRIDGRAPSQSEVLEIIDKYFHRNIKDSFSTIDNKNRARKKGANPFLQSLLDTATKRNDKLLK
jgi:RteC protein